MLLKEIIVTGINKITMSGIYSIEALQSMYKSHHKRDDKPIIEQFLKPESETLESVTKKESVEEQMMKLYEEKERNISKVYNETLYTNPIPLKEKRRNDYWASKNGDNR